MSDEEWARVHAINLNGVFYANRAAIPKMKAAVIGLTKAIGKDAAGTGVLVDCIAPAVITTPVVARCRR